ncbi:uncharacterized protein LOC121972617 [Zingiber officinale]|uniref:uncharacterized protein LOC121972617 n=1 Tax=Zingiber officinale TaxID=94328 RepID=UPI001C4AE1A2|nr:uncharacterized protein LOC121972617 [Zingiber officinale]
MASRPDQVPDMRLFDAYFLRADVDRDGRISGKEAVTFFEGSNLPRPVLAQMGHIFRAKLMYCNNGARFGRKEYALTVSHDIGELLLAILTEEWRIFSIHKGPSHALFVVLLPPTEANTAWACLVRRFNASDSNQHGATRLFWCDCVSSQRITKELHGLAVPKRHNRVLASISWLRPTRHDRAKKGQLCHVLGRGHVGPFPNLFEIFGGL